MEKFKYLETISENGRQNLTLILNQGFLVGKDKVYGFEGRYFNIVVHFNVLTQESFGNLVG